MKIKKIISLTIVALTMFSLLGRKGVYAADNSQYDEVIEASCEWLKEEVPNPESGDEWTVFCLARYDAKKYKDYINEYLQNVGEYVVEVDGVLSTYKYTEYAKLALTLEACGEDSTNFNGYDILAPLEDEDAVSLQGLNACAWALIAMDSVDYDKLDGADLSGTREQYVNILLINQYQDGGWSLDGINGYTADYSLTAMIMTALYPYKDQPEVTAALDLAADFLSRKQCYDGTFTDEGDNSSEAIAQAIVALNTCGIGTEGDAYIKEVGFVDALLTYQDGTGFSHEYGEKADLISTQQATYALISQQRAEKGQTAIFDFKESENSEKTEGSSSTTLIIILAIVAVLIITGLILLGYIKKCGKKRK